MSAPDIPETVIIQCSAHNRHVTSGPRGSIVHISGNAEQFCSSARFEVRRVRQAGRDEVAALLSVPPVDCPPCLKDPGP